jgi:hypothetical protein
LNQLWGGSEVYLSSCREISWFQSAGKSGASACAKTSVFIGFRQDQPVRQVHFLFTTSLIPAFSPRRRRTVRRVFGKTRDGIGWMVIRKTRIGQMEFPLLGERIKGEGERKTQISSASGPLFQNDFGSGSFLQSLGSHQFSHACPDEFQI